MSGPRVIVHAAEPAPLIQTIAAAHGDVEIIGCDSYAALPALIEATRPDAVFSIRFAGTPGFPRDALLGPSGPRWIAIGGSGVDHFARWDPARTTVTNAAGVAAGMMAEYVVGGLLRFTLDVPGLEEDRAARRWRAGRKVAPLAGRTLLIVGLGHTGRAVARLVRAFKMTVVGVRANPRPTPGADEVHGTDALPRLWGRADVVVVAAPLLDGTRGIMGAAAFAAMKPGVLLADVSRGGVVDQGALLDALVAGKVAGAVLDVFETEPLPGDHPLWSAPNVLLSPHCASVFEGWEIASARLFAENLTAFRAGRPLANVVDPERGY